METNGWRSQWDNVYELTVSIKSLIHWSSTTSTHRIEPDVSLPYMRDVHRVICLKTRLDRCRRWNNALVLHTPKSPDRHHGTYLKCLDINGAMGLMVALQE